MAAIAPSAEVAGLIFTSLFNFVLLFNGVLQPFNQLGWWRWMYRLSPYTYLVEGMIGNALGGQQIGCSDIEYSHVDPPSGQTCSQYLGRYISAKGGYVSNPAATSQCQFCPYRTTDEFLGNNFNIKYSHRWRDVGIFIVFIAFNISCIYAFTYLFRMKKWETPTLFKRKKSGDTQESGSRSPSPPEAEEKRQPSIA